MFSKKSRIIFITILSLITITIACILHVNNFLENPSVQNYILNKITGEYKVHTSQLKISFYNGLGISAYDLQAKSIEGSEEIEAARLTMVLDVNELLRGNIIFSDFILFQPRIKVVLKKSAPSPEVTIDSILVEKITDLLSQFRSASLQEGQVIITTLPFHFYDINFTTSYESSKPRMFNISLSGKVKSEKEHVPFTLEGTIAQDLKDKNNPFAEIAFKTGNLPLTWLSQIISLPLEEGYARADLQIKGALIDSLSVEGKIITDGLRFMVIDNDMTKDYYFLSHLDIDFKSLYLKDVITIPSLQVSAPDFSLHLQSEINLKDKTNPYLSLKIESPFMQLKSFKNIFPTPLLPVWVEERLFPALTGGEVQLAHFSLNGTFDDIKNLGLPENKNVLSMKLRWRNLETFKKGLGLPLKEIYGDLKIEDGNLLLSGLKGRFDKSLINDVFLSIKSLYDDVPLYHFSLTGSFDLDNLKEMEQHELIPEKIGNQLLRFQTLSGNLETHLKFDYKKTWDYPKIQDSEFRLKNCSLVHKNLSLPLILEKAELIIDKKGKSHFKGKGAWGKNKFHFSGSEEHSAHVDNNTVKIKAALSTSGVLLNIWSELAFKNTSSPYLSLIVKTPFVSLQSFKRVMSDSFLPKWIESRFFPSLSGGRIRVDYFSLKGTFDEIKNLNKPDNKEVLSMKISWKDVQVLLSQDRRSVLFFNNIYGNMNIEKSTLIISRLKADWGTSNLENATLSINNVYARTPMYRFSIKGNFQLDDLKDLEKLDIAPENVRYHFKRFKSLSGNLKAHVHIDYKHTWTHLKIKSSKFQLKNCSINHKDLLLPLSFDNAAVMIDKDGKSQFNGTGMWGKSEFQFSGSAEQLWKNTRVTVKARTDMDEILKQFYKENQLPVHFSHHTPLQFTLSKSRKHWLLTGGINLQSTMINTQLFSINPLEKVNKLSFSVEYYQKKNIYFKDTKWILGKSLLELSGYYNLKNKGFLNINLSSKRFVIDDLKIRNKNKNTLAKGTVTGQAKINFFPFDPSKTTVTGKLEAHGISFGFSELPFPIHDCDLKLRFTRNEISLSYLKFRLGHNPVNSFIEVEGDLRGWDGIKGDLTVRADYLDFSDLAAYKDDISFKKTSSSPNRFIEKSDVQLYIEIDKGRWKKLQYGPLKAEFTFRAGHIFIDHSEIQMGKSSVIMEGHIKTGQNPEMLFSSYIKLTEHPMKEILQSLNFDRYLEVIDVDVNSEGYIYMKGMNRKELINSLTGAVNIHMQEGVIQDPYVILRVLNSLSLSRIRKENREITQKGFYFTSIKGHITSNQGVLESDNLIMKSPPLNIAFSGKVDLNKELMDSHLEVHPLKRVSSFISKIPIIGYILTGKKKALIIYSFQVQGQLSDPQVKYQPWQNIKNIARWYYNRSINTPERLFKRTSEIKKKLLKERIPLPEEEFAH